MTWRHEVSRGGGRYGHKDRGRVKVWAEGVGRDSSPVGRQDSYHDVVMSEQLQLGQVHCHCGWAQSEVRGVN